MEEPIAASVLNDFVFCPASIFFHRMYMEMDRRSFQSTFQINGSDAHSAVDENRYSTRKNVLTSLPAYSEKYGIICKVDIFFRDEGRLVERKKKINKVYEGQVFQLYAQCFALREMGYTVRKLELYSMDDNKKIPVALPEDDAEMLKKFELTICQIVKFDIKKFVPENAEKCRSCIYEPACSYSLIEG